MTAETPPQTPKTILTLSARSELLREPSSEATVLVEDQDRPLIWIEPRAPFEHQRIWAKAKLSTRMLMVRYSAILSESEARFAWGDR